MWVLIALIGLCAVLVLILTIPIEFSFQYSPREKPSPGFKLVWLFGLVRTRFTAYKEADDRKKLPAGGRDSKTTANRPDVRVLMRIMRIKGLMAHLKRFITGTLSCIKIRQLSADITVSLDSPADTGYLFAFSAPFNYLMDTCTHWNITITPLFHDEAYFEAAVDGTVRLVPVIFFKPLARFIFAVPFLRAAVILVKEWKRKR